LPKYLTQHEAVWSLTDADIQSAFLSALERMYPQFRRQHVRVFQVNRVREMLAVSTLEYSTRLLPPTRTSVDQIFIVNSSQIANGTLNVNETVGLSARKALELRDLLPDHRTPAVVTAGAA